MKIGVISDIHANLVALREVLKDMTNEGCEKVICLGDLVLAGPQPKETLDFIRQQEDWIIIQGNTDKLIADFGSEVLQMMEDNFPVMAPKPPSVPVCIITMLTRPRAQST